MTTLPSTLRHSKAHRAKVQALQDRTLWRYWVQYPGNPGLCFHDHRGILVLTADATIVKRERAPQPQPGEVRQQGHWREVLRRPVPAGGWMS